MPEVLDPKKRDLIFEVATLIDRLLPVISALRENEADFLRSLNAKVERYGVEAFVSAAQLNWLRDLEKRYAPDPRQESLF